jgi:hypothetical protein
MAIRSGRYNLGFGGHETRAVQTQLFSGCTGCFGGSCSMMVTYADGEGGVYGFLDDGGRVPVQSGNARVEISARPWDGGIVGGTYVATFTGFADDAGILPSKTFTGRFCALAY